MTSTRLQVTPRLRELMSYDKFAGPAPRMMVLESGYWLDIACIHAARRMGWQVKSVFVSHEGVMPRENVERLLLTLLEFKPDFLLTINLGGMDMDGLFSGLFEDLAVPYVAWFVDDPRTILGNNTALANSYAVSLSWDDLYCEYLRGVGFPVVQHLPLAVDDIVFNAEPPETWDLPPTFVGNSNTATVAYEWSYFQDKPELAQGIRAAIAAGRLNRQTFIAGLDAVLEPGILAQMDADARRHVELLLFAEGTRNLRVALAQTLVPEGMVLRGDDAWKVGFPEAGGGVNYLKELPDYYRRCELNVNITSIQMPTTVNQRVFDCPAAGGFVLTDAQPELERLFDSKTEVASYSSLEECRDLFRFYRAHPDARRQITERARKRVLGEHTYTHRLNTIVGILRERFGSG
ncbi:MAG: glycosyltransferase [Candidatus Hydrogenedentes bacterium]|nr:glycosyltransferase [Candidatus Hydrogenedentota bacterium]